MKSFMSGVGQPRRGPAQELGCTGEMGQMGLFETRLQHRENRNLKVDQTQPTDLTYIIYPHLSIDLLEIYLCMYLSTNLYQSANLSPVSTHPGMPSQWLFRTLKQRRPHPVCAPSQQMRRIQYGDHDMRGVDDVIHGVLYTFMMMESQGTLFFRTFFRWVFCSVMMESFLNRGHLK